MRSFARAAMLSMVLGLKALGLRLAGPPLGTSPRLVSSGVMTGGGRAAKARSASIMSMSVSPAAPPLEPGAGALGDGLPEAARSPATAAFSGDADSGPSAATMSLKTAVELPGESACGAGAVVTCESGRVGAGV